MTYSYDNLNVIIYFIRKDNEVKYYPTVNDPYDSKFLPPVNTDSFYVSPHSHKTYEALKYIIKKILKKIEHNLEENPKK
jgi:hypothetical protein